MNQRAELSLPGMTPWERFLMQYQNLKEVIEYNRDSLNRTLSDEAVAMYRKVYIEDQPPAKQETVQDRVIKIVIDFRKFFQLILDRERGEEYLKKLTRDDFLNAISTGAYGLELLYQAASNEPEIDFNALDEKAQYEALTKRNQIFSDQRFKEHMEPLRLFLDDERWREDITQIEGHGQFTPIPLIGG